jgi:excisionase family DNA binding protein
MTDETTPHFLTLPEAAQRLQLSEKTIHRYLESSQISGMFYGRRWHFTEEDLTRFLSAQKSAEGTKGARKKRAYTRHTEAKA